MQNEREPRVSLSMAPEEPNVCSTKDQEPSRLRRSRMFRPNIQSYLEQTKLIDGNVKFFRQRVHLLVLELRSHTILPTLIAKKHTAPNGADMGLGCCTTTNMRFLTEPAYLPGCVMLREPTSKREPKLPLYRFSGVSILLLVFHRVDYIPCFAIQSR